MAFSNMLLLILAFVVAVAFIFLFRFSFTEMPASLSLSPVSLIRFDPQIQYPPGFPQELPLDQPWDVIENFQQVEAGQIISVVQYQSGESLAKNSSEYENFFLEQGWLITARQSSENSRSLMARKEGETFLYTFSLNRVSGLAYVTLRHQRLAVPFWHQK